MLLTYRSQQCVDRQGLATNFQADLPWFDKLVFWAVWGKKVGNTREENSAGEVDRGSSKKALRAMKLLPLSITSGGSLIASHTTTLIQLLSIWKGSVCPTTVPTPCFHV